LKNAGVLQAATTAGWQDARAKQRGRSAAHHAPLPHRRFQQRTDRRIHSRTASDRRGKQRAHLQPEGYRYGPSIFAGHSARNQSSVRILSGKRVCRASAALEDRVLADWTKIGDYAGIGLWNVVHGSIVVARPDLSECHRLGFRRRSSYSRRANATMMDRLGTPLKVRQEPLGRSDPLIMQAIHTHIASEDLRKVAAQLGEAVWGVLDNKWT
jgi:hypothetical protein